MNIFDKIMFKQAEQETRLGNPLRDTAAIQRRLTNFAQIMGGKGFRTPKKSPRVNAQGLTRGDRKRAAFERAFHPAT